MRIVYKNDWNRDCDIEEFVWNAVGKFKHNYPGYFLRVERIENGGGILKKTICDLSWILKKNIWFYIHLILSSFIWFYLHSLICIFILYWRSEQIRGFSSQHSFFICIINTPISFFINTHNPSSTNTETRTRTQIISSSSPTQLLTATTNSNSQQNRPLPWHPFIYKHSKCT